MRILIAEDDPVSRKLLEVTLIKWGFEVVVACDGREAWEAWQAVPTPDLLILDWMMPHLDGVEVCRCIRAAEAATSSYIILLSARDGKQDVIAGLGQGADDYLTKPFHRDELRVRIQVGMRTLRLQQALASRVRELEDALKHVSKLQELLPICCYCKRIRDDQNYWQQVETYLATYGAIRFSHGICPDCYQNTVQPELEALLGRPIPGALEVSCPSLSGGS
jgi:CheY-like chemotaxis protein